MRIGILNYHRSYNYGAFLQCYSLKERIKSDFPSCEVEVIDYIHKTTKENYLRAAQSYDVQQIRQQVEKRNAAFERCISHLDLSSERFVDDNFDMVLDYINSRYDIVVVGSDAVWNWESRGFPNIYFLKGYKGHKLSYAASAHLLRFDSVSEEQKVYLADALSEFDYLGVRDVATENFIKSIVPTFETYYNCDPTMFLDIRNLPADIEVVKEKFASSGIDTGKPIIGLMAYPYNIGQELERKYQKNSIATLYEPNQFGTYIYDLNPFEWAKSFSLFDVTLTHYFHGTLLSLENGTPVIPIEAKSEYSQLYVTKIKDVLTRLGLLDWYFTTDYNKIQRGLRRYGLNIDPKLWNKIFSMIHDFQLNNEKYRLIIQQGIKQERKSYLSFKTALEKIVNKDLKTNI